MKNSHKTIGIVAANHTGYIKALFSYMEAGHIAVPLRNEEDQYRIKATQVEKIISSKLGDAWMAPNFKTSTKHDTALITFTSGTMGNPKGVILSHHNLSNVVTRLNTLMQLDGNIREYIGVPVYHSFGLARCRAIAAVGGQLFIPPLFRPAEIGEMLKKGEINAISAVPDLWRILLANSDLIGQYGKRVQWIEIGSQYMNQKEKEQLKSLFPNARIVQHYGLTEASRSTLLEIHQEEGEKLKSVGQATGAVEIKLTATQNIAIRGPHVAQAYIVDGQKISLKDKDGWLVTQDLGNIRNNYLYYEGRSDDIINYGGIKISPVLLENKIYEKLDCQDGLAICRDTESSDREGFLVAVTQEINIKKRDLHKLVSQTLREFDINAFNAITVIEVTHLPRTASGKIQRRKLSSQINQLS